MIETYYRILKHNREGKLVEDSGLTPSRSYVIQFLELIQGFHDNLTKNATDVDEAESVIFGAGGTAGSYGRIDAPVGDNTYGIVIGTNAGTTAEDNENHALDTKIAEGVASGEISYQATTFITPTEAVGNIDFDITRTFLNEHATDPVTVKEIGIICKNSDDTKYHLLLRDVVTDKVVEHGYTLSVVYTLRTTV